MVWSILIGLGLVALIVGVVYELKHRKAAPPATASTVAVTLAPALDQLRSDFREALSGVPALVSAEVVRLTGALDAALQRAEAAETALEAERAAHTAALGAVAARVSAAIAGSPELAPVAAAEPA